MTWPHGKLITPPPGVIIKWGGWFWKPAPDGVHWHRWEPGVDSRFEMIVESTVPDQVWVELAKMALLK